jgi:hypothetical protein
MRSNLGGALDGVLCEYRVWPAGPRWCAHRII